MAKWKLFGRFKVKEDEEVLKESEQESSEELIDIETKQEDKILAEHTETLYSKGTTPKKKDSSLTKSTYPSDQRIWRDVNAIEENIDHIHKTKSNIPHSKVEKTVDQLIEKRKLENSETTKPKKPSNVIYVVSKPQPGEVRGDWAVRSHGKIFSHHKTKEKAIDEARKVAKKRDATVMVQNTDGTFSNGFKPR